MRTGPATSHLGEEEGEKREEEGERKKEREERKKGLDFGYLTRCVAANRICFEHRFMCECVLILLYIVYVDFHRFFNSKLWLSADPFNDRQIDRKLFEKQAKHPQNT